MQVVSILLSSLLSFVVWLPPELRRAALDWRERRREASSRGSRRPIRLYLIRHGQSIANLDAARTVGGRDVSSPLSAKGEAQAAALGNRLQRELAQSVIDDARIYASHAVRARSTAEIACQKLGVPAEAIQIDPRVVEFSQGALEKRPRAEVYAADGPVMKGLRAESGLFFRPPGYSPDGDRGESQYDVECRMRAFAESLLKPQSAPADCVLVFSHGIAIRAFVRSVIGAQVDFCIKSETDNTAITELEYRTTPGDLGGWRLVRFNDHSHLMGIE